MRPFALLLLCSLGLVGCVVAPLEPVPAVYATPPAVVVTPHHHRHHRYHRHHRHRYWR